ncbi:MULTISPECIES: MarR family winged helix-turn-helix transcriptional regulator [Thalassospira]|uniref:MarR family winged helix-turn-helix transcriptional regulator n=1 Tax=Thalassospira TaxID=168934 RepID=UPI001B23965F|nr:MarR family transcriptional regulator [Thalassospira sp.]MBO6773416.1 MarR family transcriptional regulator [Thalassospira sp.]
MLKLASKATARALQNRLAKQNVAYGHWTFLRILWQDDGLSVTELCRRASVAKPAGATALHAMEKLGYLTKEQKPGNQKAIYIYLTEQGRELEKELVPLALEVNELALNGLCKSQQETLRTTLSVIIKNLETENS